MAGWHLSAAVSDFDRLATASATMRPMKAKLIAVGERAPRWVAEGFGEYQKRLSHWLPLDLVEIEPGLRGKGRDAARATQDEGARALSALPWMGVAGCGRRNSSRNGLNTGVARVAIWRS
jgi:hypothetical protein